MDNLHLSDTIPLVSVIIPVYNTEQYIADCLSSVICQTYKNIEIICIDDGSDDFSVNVIKEFQKSDNRIKIILKENGGASSARNVGIKHAAGKYISFIDSDDRIEQGAIQRLVECAELNKADVVHFNIRAFFESDELLEKFKSYNTYYVRQKTKPGTYKKGELFSALVCNKEFKPHPCISFLRTEFVKDNNIFFYEGIIHEDDLFSPIVMISAETVVYIEDVLYLRRIREGSTVTKDKTVANVAGYFTAATELAGFREHTEMANEISEALKKYIYVRVKLGFDIYDRLKLKGVELIDVKNALNTTRDKWLFELIDSVRVF